MRDSTTSACAGCGRKLYTAGASWAAASEPYRRGPFQAFDSEAHTEMHKEWGWRSAWVPDLCRFCDKDHDHRYWPGLLYRLRRWWKGRA